MLNVLKVNKDELHPGGLYEYLYSKKCLNKLLKSYDPKTGSAELLSVSELKKQTELLNQNTLYPIPRGRIAALENPELTNKNRAVLAYKFRHYSNTPMLNQYGDVLPSTGIRHFGASKLGTTLLLFDVHLAMLSELNLEKWPPRYITDDWCDGDFYRCQCERNGRKPIGNSLKYLPEDLVLKSLEYLELRDYIAFGLTNKDNKKLSFEFKQYWLNLSLRANIPINPIGNTNSLKKKSISSDVARRFAKIYTNLQYTFQKFGDYENMVTKIMQQQLDFTIKQAKIKRTGDLLLYNEHNKIPYPYSTSYKFVRGIIPDLDLKEDDGTSYIQGICQKLVQHNMTLNSQIVYIVTLRLNEERAIDVDIVVLTKHLIDGNAELKPDSTADILPGSDTVIPREGDLVYGKAWLHSYDNDWPLALPEATVGTPATEQQPARVVDAPRIMRRFV